MVRENFLITPQGRVKLLILPRKGGRNCGEERGKEAEGKRMGERKKGIGGGVRRATDKRMR